jgi:RHS repeat-associated protein
MSSTGTLTSPLGFAGGYTDAETGFEYLVNRYYDPASDQFLSVDPLEASTRAPYYYAGDNAVNYNDPSGAATEGKCGSASILAAVFGVHAGGGQQLCIVHTTNGTDEWGITETSITSIQHGLSADFGISVEYQISSATHLEDLKGSFSEYTGAVPVKAIYGADVTVFWGSARDSSQVVGADLGASVGAGAGAVEATTWTSLQEAHSWYTKLGLMALWTAIVAPSVPSVSVSQIRSVVSRILGNDTPAICKGT